MDVVVVDVAALVVVEVVALMVGDTKDVAVPMVEAVDVAVELHTDVAHSSSAIQIYIPVTMTIIRGIMFSPLYREVVYYRCEKWKVDALVLVNAMSVPHPLNSLLQPQVPHKPKQTQIQPPHPILMVRVPHKQ